MMGTVTPAEAAHLRMQDAPLKTAEAPASGALIRQSPQESDLPIPARARELHGDITGRHSLCRGFSTRLSDLVARAAAADAGDVINESKRDRIGIEPGRGGLLRKGPRRAVPSAQALSGEALAQAALKSLSSNPGAAISRISAHIEQEAERLMDPDERLLVRFEFGIALLYLMRAAGPTLPKELIPKTPGYYYGFKPIAGDSEYSETARAELESLRGEMLQKGIKMRSPDPDIPTWNLR